MSWLHFSNHHHQQSIPDNDCLDLDQRWWKQQFWRQLWWWQIMMIRMAITMIIIRFDRSLAPCLEALKQQAQTYRGLPNSSKSKKWFDEKKGKNEENFANIYQSVINNINRLYTRIGFLLHLLRLLRFYWNIAKSESQVTPFTPFLFKYSNKWKSGYSVYSVLIQI